ncbi:hypothetical protein BJ742DRAFT_913163 [Cladochytrium replicatum]|nr:hypothetical protein BJ742DRAFT_913163 [Cladochytrium replicatum]
MLFFNQFTLLLFVIIMICLFIYKGMWFPYAPAALPLEILGFAFLSFLECARLYYGNRGNKKEELLSTIIFSALTLISIIGYLFFCLWQSYVMIVDVVACCPNLLFNAGEVILGITQIVTLKRMKG